MTEYAWIFLIVALFFLLLAVFLLIQLWQRSGKNGQNQEALGLLRQQMLESSGQQDQRLGRIGEQLSDNIGKLNTALNERLTQNQMLAQQTQKSMTEQLTAAGKTIADLKGQLGKLGQATDQISQVGSEVKKLQDILQQPKLRGGLGEWSLENLLADVLPQKHYTLQYGFKSGVKVDALVRLAHGNVCIDAKFPLPNFQAILEAQDESSRQKSRKAFLKDVRKRIDEIAEKYILPEEGTLDFALMYIPAENVYYEATMTQLNSDTDICTYGRERKVIPVSPNTLYGYLMVIAMGLKGLQIEENAQLIRKQLSQMVNDLQLFSNDFALVGKHLNNAQGKYNDATKRLDRYDMQLRQIETDSGKAKA